MSADRAPWRPTRRAPRASASAVPSRRARSPRGGLPAPVTVGSRPAPDLAGFRVDVIDAGISGCTVGRGIDHAGPSGPRRKGAGPAWSANWNRTPPGLERLPFLADSARPDPDRMSPAITSGSSRSSCGVGQRSWPASGPRGPAAPATSSRAGRRAGARACPARRCAGPATWASSSGVPSFSLEPGGPPGQALRSLSDQPVPQSQCRAHIVLVVGGDAVEMGLVVVDHVLARTRRPPPTPGRCRDPGGSR